MTSTQLEDGVLDRCAGGTLAGTYEIEQGFQTSKRDHEYWIRITTSTSPAFLLSPNVGTNAAIFPGRLMRR